MTSTCPQIEQDQPRPFSGKAIVPSPEKGGMGGGRETRRQSFHVKGRRRSNGEKPGGWKRGFVIRGEDRESFFTMKREASRSS